MAKKIIFIFLITGFLYFPSLIAQVRMIVIADSTSKLPLPYATVKIINRNSGYFADRNAALNILALENDSLLLTYVGYETLVLPLRQIIDTVFLKRKTYDLSEVVIRAYSEEHNAGIFKYKKSWTIFFDESSEYALRIDLSGINGTYLIKKIFLPIEFNNNTFENSICKVHIYRVGNNGKPGEELLTKSVIIDKKYSSKKDFYIDISDQKLVASDKVLFVGVECIMDKIVAQYKSNLSEKRDFNQRAKVSPVSLFISKETVYFDDSYDHKFFRNLKSKNYNWHGGTYLNKDALNFAAGLVVLTGK